ncbi:translation initiation factor IF-3 [Candidatus Woesebacteria bacterium RIFCSPLOWO2_01_FULL_39_23]|uniref:Translation initiation factor IF-3 n=1 Tax=Candidatus Woesebacteria bacterium RIFCSPHIGHO2_01_FULL_40_22 TaxID=1802499 RepID=A0A1F7YKH8_9BACT|nr:MAG: translation initiation factor IF-3 [Candidatus Woesebacteria bacterium RBG_16_40_11]OGM27389.1 MAG: translation initiation factor IF-3 [Candidatus Woesebacteria bacterium RIFCSPHIGHO2_01_FULL_40_22]OGM37278.1 MAG: translation initiation factor IF-3 [Candidatus Woesebacteria bacterium RIFCSPHIGHO2_12_FULL_38_9]OGM62561.1 MAG: translation initiation factor IF-3 [Candidatus Woesebacteria bacterium RIFCSPLOWO2_01_FULL_39_23]
MKTANLYWRINQQIHAPEVRVVGADGKQIGVLKLSQALDEARKAGLDLVEIAPNAKPPVTKIVELGKFRYQEEKKLRREKKGSKSGGLKEIRFSPFIGDHDYTTRLERVKEFLADKNKVRLVVVFKGRQMGRKEFGYDLLTKTTNELGGSITIDSEPKFFGRHLAMTISPVNKPKLQTETENDQK